MIRYVHGSADSTDQDVVYVFDTMPAFTQCQQFCQSDPKENRNIVVIEDGIVVQCFKGHRDEVNNALLTTIPLHPQDHPLPIQRRVERDIFLKDIVVTRKILSPLTRSALRPRIKAALHGEWPDRIRAMQELDLTGIDFDAVGTWDRYDLLKSMAFQLGQGLGLHRGVELYTKQSIAEQFPALRPYLYRQACGLQELQNILTEFADVLSQIETLALPERRTQLLPSGDVYDIHREIHFP